MIYTTEMMRTLARQHDEDSDTRAALMQAADNIDELVAIVIKYEDALFLLEDAEGHFGEIARNARNTKGE